MVSFGDFNGIRLQFRWGIQENFREVLWEQLRERACLQTWASFQYIVIIDEFSKIDFSTPLWFPSEILMAFNSILGGESRKTFEKSCGNSCEKGHASKHGPLFNTL